MFRSHGSIWWRLLGIAVLLLASADGCVRPGDDEEPDGGAGGIGGTVDGPVRVGVGGEGGAGDPEQPPACGGRCMARERCVQERCVACGAANQICCSDDDAGCAAGQICVGGGQQAAQAGMCRGCGANGQQCCPTEPACQMSLGCIDGPGTMDLCGTCGGANQPCCSDTAAGCAAGHRCTSAKPTDPKTCLPCGAMDQPCCDGEMPCRAPLGCVRMATGAGICGGCGTLNQPCCTGQQAPCSSNLRCRSSATSDRETCQP